MNDSSNQGYPHAVDGEQEPRSLQLVSGEFGRSVSEAAEKLGSAAERFVSMTSDILNESRTAAEEAKSAVEGARTAASQAQDAQRAAESVSQQLDQRFGDVTQLVRDLQERIAALAVLARPIVMPETPAAFTPPEAEETREPVAAWASEPSQFGGVGD